MYKLNKILPTKGGLNAVLLGKVFQSYPMNRRDVYIGYIETTEGLIHPTRWLTDGTNETNYNHSLLKITEEFGIGKWKTVDPKLIGVVTTMSPHLSSAYRLIGYVMDCEGRMYPERWDMQGRAASNGNWNLDKFADHTELPF